MKYILKITGIGFLLLISVLFSCKKEKVPTLTTTTVTNISGTTATSGGTITDEGSGTITVRGVCWSTTLTPTIADKKTVNGAGAGTFTSNLTELNKATTYYVRAYASNKAGTGYGMVMSFNTLTIDVPTNELVAYYPFNGNANDESGNGNNGIVDGATITTDRFGNSNSAYSFDGINDLISVISNNRLNSYPITINAFIKTTSQQPHLAIVNKYYCLSNNGYSLHLNYGNLSAFYYGSNNIGINFDGSITSPVNNGIWNMLTLIVDNAIGEIYLNGTLITSLPFSELPIKPDTPQNITFGYFPTQGNCLTSNPYYNGSIDDIGIWNRVLTQNEIMALYNGPTK